MADGLGGSGPLSRLLIGVRKTAHDAAASRPVLSLSRSLSFSCVKGCSIAGFRSVALAKLHLLFRIILHISDRKLDDVSPPRMSLRVKKAKAAKLTATIIT